jgi:glycosyltransferase involved in cell wall biosynthesis
MLSILIPVYNYDVRAFVKCLSDQSVALNVPVEIICLDDASESKFQTLNVEVDALPNVKYIASEVNLGRSAIRNEMVSKAQFEHLLFLDCDGRCVYDDYLSRYMQAWSEYDVIYGGRIYNDRAPDDHDLYFHWYCGQNREALLAPARQENPFKSFMTNNFLVRRAVYDQVKMDEGVVGYGHEDTLFAQELKRAGFHIDHIDNPIEHEGIEPFEVFLRKSENGVRNLAQLIKSKKVDDSIRLVRFYHKLHRFGMLPIIAWLVRRMEGKIIQNLRGPAPNLLWFDLWKLSKLSKLYSHLA